MNSKEQTVRDIYAFVAGSDLDPHCMEEAIEILDQHAAEARADQAEKCGNATKSVFELYGPLITFPIVMQACLNAVEKEDE